MSAVALSLMSQIFEVASYAASEVTHDWNKPSKNSKAQQQLARVWSVY